MAWMRESPGEKQWGVREVVGTLGGGLHWGGLGCSAGEEARSEVQLPWLALAAWVPL